MKLRTGRRDVRGVYGLGTLMQQERVGQWLMALLVGLFLVGAVLVPWRSTGTMDERTYLEMALGIQRTGVPEVANGPVGQFPMLQAQWNMFRDGKLWGVYTPAYPYIMAPILAAAGTPALFRLNLALMALLALGVYYLAKTALNDHGLAPAIAAWIAVASAPVWSLGVSPYPLAITSIPWVFAFLLQAQRTGERGKAMIWAASAGVVLSFAAACHMLIMPMLFGFWLLLAYTRRWSVVAAGGLATLPILLALAYLNHIRFGEWNPFTDGPWAWANPPVNGDSAQSVGGMLEFGLPMLLLTCGAAMCWWFMRRLKYGWLFVGTLSLLIAAMIPAIREPGARILTLLWALLVDSSRIDMGTFTRYDRLPDGLGNFLGGRVVKSVLQVTPLFIMAVVGMRRLPRFTAVTLVLPSLGILAAVLLRGNSDFGFAMGAPYLHLRYMMPMVPLLVVLTMAGLRDVSWGRWHLVGSLVLFVSLSPFLWSADHDFAWPHRWLLLRGTLLCSGLLLIAYLLRQRFRVAQTAFAGLAFAAATLGFVVAIGTDLKAIMRWHERTDEYVDRVAAHIPQRLALFGQPLNIDAPLTLLVSRDIQYVDSLQVKDWRDLRPLVLWWLAENRPVFGFPPDGLPLTSPWPDLQFSVIDPQLRLVQVTKVE